MRLVSFLAKKPGADTTRPSLPSWELAPKARWGLALERDGKIFIRDFTSKKHASLLSLIEAGPAAWRDLRTLEKKLLRGRGLLGVPMERVTLLSPLPRPSSLRDFLAFEEHSSWSWKKRGLELPPEWYEMPVFYKGNPRTFFGSGNVIPWPSYTQKMDYELEVAMIVGRKGRDIPKDKARSHIFGYAVLNDWSARDIQAKEMICRLGPAKGKDFATSLGPWIVTADEVDDSSGLRMQAFINGEKWSDGNSSTRRWSFEDMIAHVSRDELIYPGDVYGSGTVGRGCGLELDRWLKPGDLVELEIEGLGRLANRVQTATIAAPTPEQRK